MLRCKFCGKQFHPKTKVSKFCSRSCKNKNYYHTIGKKRYKKKKNKKIICGNPKCSNEILTKGIRKYCSLKCRYMADYYRNKETKLKIAKKRYLEKRDTKEFKKNRKEYLKKYYEKNKEQIYKSVMNNYEKDYPKWKIRAYSRTKRGEFGELRGNKCENCGSVKNLQIHHKRYTINYNDWQLLCKECHRKTHRSLNTT